MISFWNGNHPRQKEYELLAEKIPPVGEADTFHIELIRCVGNLYYEWCNNGNLNAAEWVFDDCCCDYGIFDEDCGCDGDEDCYCGGTGRIEEDCYDCNGEGKVPDYLELSGKYADHLQFLKENGINTLEVEYLITDELKHYSYDYSQEEYDIYNKMVTDVLDLISVTENKEFSV